MKISIMHPADQIVTIMNRVYENGLTTTSGGNISIMEDNGDIWISPRANDKGALTARDICCVKPDGTVIGPHNPSVELPFHRLVYQKRPDIRAVLHAHPPMTVAFSVVRKLPELNMIANTRHVCGKLTVAPYILPGSIELGEALAEEFTKGFNLVVMENHGLVTGGTNLFDAYMKFETLEAAAQIQVNAGKLGTLKPFSNDTFTNTILRNPMAMGDFVVSEHSAEECAARRDIIKFLKRSYKYGLVNSTNGTFSVRLSNGSFLITPHGNDRAYLTEEDLVLIQGDMKEHGKTPSRAVRLHKAIYDRNPKINVILAAQPPHAMAFAVTDNKLDSRTIPESYIQLRQVQKVDFATVRQDMDKVASLFSEKNPVLICENSQIIATGATLLSAFDRLEMSDATAKALLATKNIGEMVSIKDEEVADLDRVFIFPFVDKE